MGAVFIYLPVGITAVIGLPAVSVTLSVKTTAKSAVVRVTLPLRIWRSSRVSPCTKPERS